MVHALYCYDGVGVCVKETHMESLLIVTMSIAVLALVLGVAGVVLVLVRQTTHATAEITLGQPIQFLHTNVTMDYLPPQKLPKAQSDGSFPIHDITGLINAVSKRMHFLGNGLTMTFSGSITRDGNVSVTLTLGDASVSQYLASLCVNCQPSWRIRVRLFIQSTEASTGVIGQTYVNASTLNYDHMSGNTPDFQPIFNVRFKEIDIVNTIDIHRSYFLWVQVVWLEALDPYFATHISSTPLHSTRSSVSNLKIGDIATTTT